MLNNWVCSKHKQENINFICIGNVWHFQPLCNSCLPQHTKNHPKNIKVQLQPLKNVIPQTLQLKKKVVGMFQQRAKKSIILKEIAQHQYAYIRNLNQKRQNILLEVNNFFDELVLDFKKRRIQQQSIQKQNLQKVRKTIEQKIIFFKRQDYEDLGIFCNEIKKYYFKEDLQIYVEQIDELMQDYQQKIIKYNPFIWSKQLNLKIKSLIKQSYKIDDLSQKKNMKQKIDVVKKDTKKKQPNKKKCPNCKQEMEYLTQWKKHLVCRSCGGKERNYIKKT